MPIQTPLQAQVFQPGEYLSNGTVTLKNGQTIPFHTVCQDHLLYDGDKAIGSMFSYSYFRSDVEDPASRPVIFLFNGGPGSGSMWLHAGTFAPWRLKFDDPEGVQQPHLPPYRVENNEYCLLDVADLVFIDPVACGYGRLLDPDAGERFFGMDADATSFDNLIHSWLAKHERWASPKYLLGESYGTSRAALIAESLSGGARLEYAPVYLNGLILLGNNIRTGIANISTNDGVEESVLLLPTAAATNWYHNKLPGTVAEFVAECYAFCEEEYVTALYRGDTIPDELRNHIAEKVAYFAGLSKELVLELNLRPKKNDYLKQVLKDRDLEVGRYDSRFTLPYNRSNAPGFMVRDDPAQAQFAPPFVYAISGPMKKKLNITFDRKFYGASEVAGNNWKRSAERHPAQCLAASMRRNPKMKVLFANGYYDLACMFGEARYLATHSGLPLDRVSFAIYPSGHMSYLGEEGELLFYTDVRAMVTGQ